MHRLLLLLLTICLLTVNAEVFAVGRLQLKIKNISGAHSLDIDDLKLTAQMNGRRLWQINLNANLKQIAAEQWQLQSVVHLADQYDGKRHLLKWSVDDLAFAASDGSFLGEGLKLTGSSLLSIDKTGLNFQNSKLQLQEGELLSPVLYADFSAKSWLLSSQSLKLQNDIFKLQKLNFTDDETSISIDNLHWQQSLQKLQLEIAHLPLQSVYSHYLQPVIASDFSSLQLGGNIAASVKIDHGQLQQYQLKLNQAGIIQNDLSGQQQYRINGIDGVLRYDINEKLASLLHVQQAQLLDTINFGSTDIHLNMQSAGFELHKPMILPIFDHDSTAVSIENHGGSLEVDRLSFKWTDNQPAIAFSGVLTPIRLNYLSRAFGWPELDGQISGVIPEISYHDGKAEIAGIMLVKVFDGFVKIRNVEASHLLSSWPVLNADIELQHIDLEKLTGKFQFGKITGLLNGHIDNLQLENWQPSVFDASFATDPQSPSRRITQEAVDNIANLGGVGVSGAISRTFLRFFEDFGYDSLGFSCVLRDKVCLMDGVADAETGYYLVKGRGLPRIDVIGYNRETDWEVMLDRLMNISTAEPTIQ